ncbi:ankyrin repeat-containing domain protein [Apodospora peruviana]|uniref:Ankyrin repeat-containing domain protein n=1 Tax=Apodospora peruviana TaxID=516989 RepID=A0AAE0M0C3_9PEZI|nr:ankyrin repeat-containing domain protein [Apodospora peruviana]
MTGTVFQHSPIDLSTDAIRLVRLLRGSGGDPIKCEVFETHLHRIQGIPYEALSYTWGDSPVAIDITICGRKATIRDNLNTALCCLRYSDRDRILWIDALCIDQDSHEEKAHQVGQMRAIYENAENVQIWLGRSSEDVDLLMELMNQLDKRARRRKEYRRNSPDAWLNEWPVLLNELGGLGSDFNIRRRDALFELLNRPLFRRVWIIHEVFSAKAATITCGWNSVPTRTFILMPRLMEVDTDPHVQAVLDIMPGYLRETSWRSVSPSLSILLKKFAGLSRATDPRDNIYALLGISSDAGSDGFPVPDYSPAVTMRHAIQKTMSYLIFPESSTGVGRRPVCEMPDWNLAQLVGGDLDNLAGMVLEWALMHGKSETAIEILKMPTFDVNGSHCQEEAPLVYLANKPMDPNLQRVVLTILDRDDANVNITNKDGETPLNVAARTVNGTMVRILLSHHRQDVNLNHVQKGGKGRTPLGAAVEGGYYGMAALLLEHPGVDVNFPNGSEYKTLTPLCLAVANGDRKMVGLLIDKGANLEAPDTLEGAPPLWIAASRGHFGLVELLLNRGANIEAGDSWLGKTVLWMAASEGHADIVRLLLDRGANIGSKDLHKRTPFWIAARQGHVDVVRMFLGHGGVERAIVESRVNFAEDAVGSATALWAAAQNGHAEVCRVLLDDAGADVEAKDCVRQSPLWVAASKGHVDVVELLLARGAEVEARDSYYDCTPLWIAAYRRNRVVVKMLIQAGADTETTKGRGEEVSETFMGDVEAACAEVGRFIRDVAIPCEWEIVQAS